jgi:hypothetical protein
MDLLLFFTLENACRRPEGDRQRRTASMILGLYATDSLSARVIGSLMAGHRARQRTATDELLQDGVPERAQGHKVTLQLGRFSSVTAADAGLELVEPLQFAFLQRLSLLVWQSAHRSNERRLSIYCPLNTKRPGDR